MSTTMTIRVSHLAWMSSHVDARRDSAVVAQTGGIL